MIKEVEDLSLILFYQYWYQMMMMMMVCWGVEEVWNENHKTILELLDVRYEI